MSPAEKMTNNCNRGRGRRVTLRQSKVHLADYYLCDTRQDGTMCASKVPALRSGRIRVADIFAAASFWGDRDVRPDARQAASVMRAREIVAAGMAQVAIEKARRCN